MTDPYVVIGNPIAHSKSPLIHRHFAGQTGQDMCYDALLAPQDGFRQCVVDFIARGGRGANVTVPFKEEAFRLATRLTPRARAAGAVNTLKFDGDDILGDNTDGAGLVRDITTNLGISLQGKRILLLGAGGAARGVLLPLLQQTPASLLIANRSREKAQTLARLAATTQADLPPVSVEAAGFDELTKQSFDIIINATSAGLSDAALPLGDTLFAENSLAYDMLYGRQTAFMRQAGGAGARVADGLGMLVEQAAEAFFLWRGIRPATDDLLRELRSA